MRAVSRRDKSGQHHNLSAFPGIDQAGTSGIFRITFGKGGPGETTWVKISCADEFRRENCEQVTCYSRFVDAR